jgi:hypothetical protein
VFVVVAAAAVGLPVCLLAWIQQGGDSVSAVIVYCLQLDTQEITCDSITIGHKMLNLKIQTFLTTTT